MRDITSKKINLKSAKSTGAVICSKEAFDIVKAGNIPKGNIFDIAKAAGFLAAKNTHNLIPHCHPVSIDGLHISFEYFEPGSELMPGIKDKYGISILSEA